MTFGKTKFEKGEVICTAYNTTSPIIQLNGMINVLCAKPARAMKYYEKENIICSDCYALEDGIIHYEEDTAFGDVRVFIGKTEYAYNPMCMYVFPEGAKVKKFDRICSGIVNMQNHVAKRLKDKINDIYLIFRKQVYTITSPDFAKTGLSSMSDVQEEILELLFTGLTNTTIDTRTNKIEEVNYLGASNSALSKKSFYTMLSYGYANRVVGKALKGEVNIEDDVMTNVVLGLLINEKLDD